tara:strand:+ start:5322 stop:6572 length:1251 start_codon:yes stop_codon:yes gene_type:complete
LKINWLSNNYYLLVFLLILSYSVKGQNNFIPQSKKKCGIPSNGKIQSFRDNQNWGYGYDSLIVDLDRWDSYSFVTIDSIGATVQNRAIWELTISENAEANSNHRIYIHARTHPGEEESFWVTNEIINILISESPFAEFVRSNCIFHIIPMYNPDGVELGYPRENANGIDIESGWDDIPLEPEVAVLKNRFSNLMLSVPNPVKIALNMHSAYSCTRYFVFHDEVGTSENYAILEQQFIGGIQSFFPGGFENWDYFVSWTSGTPDQYPESWWWMNHGENVMALTYEDMNCEQAGLYDSTANAILRGICDYIGLNYINISDENGNHPAGFSLGQNYPNPFNAITLIPYTTIMPGRVTITILDIMGHEVLQLVNSDHNVGKYFVKWDGTNRYKRQVGSGIYFYRIQAGLINKTRKMLLIQ